MKKKPIKSKSGVGRVITHAEINALALLKKKGYIGCLSPEEQSPIPEENAGDAPVMHPKPEKTETEQKLAVSDGDGLV